MNLKYFECLSLYYNLVLSYRVCYGFSSVLRLGKKSATGALAKPTRGRNMLRQRKCKEEPKRDEREGEKGKNLEKL